MPQDSPVVVTVGAALSANKGAASMLYALVDHIEDVLPGVHIRSLSTHPAADRQVNRSERLEIVSYTPLQMLVLHLPMAVLIGLSRLLGLRGRAFAVTPALRAIMDAEAVADLAGISFSDGRGLPTLIYNTLMTGIPLLVGTPVVKCSQAIGPLDYTTTSSAARLVLPRLRAVVARGERTFRHLVDFGLDNVEKGADLAFLMEIARIDEASAKDLLVDLGTSSYFVVSASSVVDAMCNANGTDYAALMAETIEKVTASTGFPAVLIAHSAQPGRGPGRMNDLPVVSQISDRCANGTPLLALNADLDPRVLRAIVGGGRFLLASRFHAMISGLATGTPIVVVGWSHKYQEVMKEFGLERFVLSFSEFSAGRAAELSLEAISDGVAIASRIEAELPRVRESSARSLSLLAEAINA